MTGLLSRRVVGLTSTVAALSALYTYSGTLVPALFYGTMSTPNTTVDLKKIGKNLVKKVPSMQVIFGLDKRDSSSKRVCC